MNKPTKEEAFDLSDSTDWLKTPLPLLSSVDSALRCQVCKDFYTTPMITSCAHTFCSLCIRRCLNNDGRCPACRAQDQELKLRFNGTMEDLVQAFKLARPQVWEFANKPVEIVQRVASPKRSRELEEGEDEGPRKLRRTRSSGRNKPKEKTVVVDSAEDDEDYVPEDGHVQCPVCQKFVKEDKINAHLDRNCEDEPPSKPKATPAFGSTDKLIPRPERLPQLHYSMVKDNILRKKLADLGLSTGGTRQQLEKRYTEWITLWNANCDATKPKGKGELKRELDVWERTQGSRAATSRQDSGAQIREKDFDGQAWSTVHGDTFKQLIANARKKAAVRPTTPPESGLGMVDLTGSPSPMKMPNLPPLEEPAKGTEEPIETPEDPNMSNSEELPQRRIEESPTKQVPQRRFFEESSADLNILPPSSQYSGISSGINLDHNHIGSQSS